MVPAFEVKGTLQDLNSNPSTLIQNISGLWESQQMYDLYAVVIYNGAQRAPMESAWQQWTECRIPDNRDSFLNLIDFPLKCTENAVHAPSPRTRICRAIVTYHEIRQQAEAQSLKPLALEASKKLTDYILLYRTSHVPRATLESRIPDWNQWFKEAIRCIQNSLTQSQDSQSIARQSWKLQDFTWAKTRVTEQPQVL